MTRSGPTPQSSCLVAVLAGLMLVLFEGGRGFESLTAAAIPLREAGGRLLSSQPLPDMEGPT
jgi:hypothetical protein